VDKILGDIRAYLNEHGDQTIRDGTKRFFKEEIRCHGFKTSEVASLAKRHFKVLKNVPKSKVFALCEALWRSGYQEESFIACEWAYALRKQYAPEDFEVFASWVSNYVSNWAACDTLCNHTVGTFIQMYPEYLPELKHWAVSSNRWMRRAATVTLIIPARQGLFLPESFMLADLLLQDADDLVQKGYGWLLKAASQAHEDEVFCFVMARRANMPRTALRYAIEKMSLEHKAEAMKR